MSNVLKKITKKYKWLRFLNYKTTKLAVLSAALFGLCLSSGASFAKYRDENYGGGNAGAAKFGATLNYVPETISVSALLDSDLNKKCALLAKFTVSFTNSEVSNYYSINLRVAAYPTEDWNPSWGDEGEVNQTSFIFTSTSAQNLPLSLVKNNQTYERKEGISSLTGDNDLFESGKAYYATGSMSKDGISISYSWDTCDLDSDKKTLNVCSNKYAKPGEIHYYAILFFVNVTRSTVSLTLEKSSIIYDLSVIQAGD